LLTVCVTVLSWTCSLFVVVVSTVGAFSCVSVLSSVIGACTLLPVGSTILFSTVLVLFTALPTFVSLVV